MSRLATGPGFALIFTRINPNCSCIVNFSSHIVAIYTQFVKFKPSTKKKYKLDMPVAVGVFKL